MGKIGEKQIGNRDVREMKEGRILHLFFLHCQNPSLNLIRKDF